MERKSVTVASVKKVKEFLEKQKDFVYKSEIAHKAVIDYNSLNLILADLDIETIKNVKGTLIKLRR